MLENDKALLAKKGISEEKLADQLKQFAEGFPFLKLSAAASLEKGILAPSAEEQAQLLAAWDQYVAANHKVVKFVPASGAASRMFKDVFSFVDAAYDAPE